MTDVLDLTNTTDLLGDPLSFATAEAAWKVSRYSGSGALLDLTGNGHDLTFGSTSGADTNDPLWLPYTGTAHIYLPGTVGNSAQANNGARGSTGDLTLIAKLRASDYTPGASVTLMSMNNTANQRCWLWRILTTGVMRLDWYADGINNQATFTSGAVGITDDTDIWFKAEFDVDNGAGGKTCTFSKSTDYNPDTETGIWTVIEAVTTAAATSIFNGTSAIFVGYDGAGSDPLVGRLYRAIVKTGIGGGATTFFDCDFTDLSKYASGYGSLTEKSANAATVTLNRSASGRKLAVVDRSLLLLGTDDYLETPDAATLDFGASDSFTVLVAVRRYGTSATPEILLSKKGAPEVTSVGWHIKTQADNKAYMEIADGSFMPFAGTAAALTDGVASVVAARRSVAADQLQMFLNGVAGTAATDTTTGTLANALAPTIGRFSGLATGYLSGEFIGAALYRYALTADECVREGRKLLAA